MSTHLNDSIAGFTLCLLVLLAILPVSIGLSFAQSPQSKMQSASPQAADPKIQEALQLIQQAMILHKTGKHQEALDYAQRGLKTLKPLLPPDHPTMTQIRFMLEAIPILQQAEKMPQVFSPLKQAQKYIDATKSSKQTPGLLQQTLSPQAQLNFRTRFSHLLLLIAQGDMAAARPLIEQLMQDLEQQAGPEKLEASGIRSLLAFLHTVDGDYDIARPELEKALEAIDNSFGKNHPMYRALLTALGALQQIHGETETAQQTLKQAQQLKSAKQEGILDALSEVMLGAALCEQKRKQEHGSNAYGKICKGPGRQHVEKAMEIANRILTPIKPDIAHMVRERAADNYTDGGPVKWRPFVERAYTYTAHVFGDKHPFLVDYLGMLGRMDWEAGNLTQARKRFRQAGIISQAHVQNTLPYLAFAEQRAFLSTKIPNQISQLLSANREGQALHDAYSLLFRWKGLLVESLRQYTLLTKRLILEPQHLPTVNRLQSLRQDIAGWFHQAEQVPAEDWQRKNEALTREKESLERELARAFPNLFEDPLKETDLSHFQRLLAPDEAFLDIYRYTFWEPSHNEEERYAAVLMTAKQAPVLIDLGAALKVEQAGKAWRGRIKRSQSSAAAWRHLAKAVWQPLAEALPSSVHKLWLSPDDELARLPWHLFPETEKHSPALLVTQIDSARAFARLRRHQPVRPQRPKLLLVGAVDFNAGITKAGHVKAEQEYPPLPATAEEINQLKRLGQRQHLTVHAFETHLAHKRIVKAYLPTATYAHLATHGFFSPRSPAQRSTEMKPGQPRKASYRSQNKRNPLIESGLALAGANADDATRMAAPGLLTAEELVGMDLSKVRLVTLSACDTGLGQEVTGQGVMGLRSAVMAAGARSLLMSMWKVPDEATRYFMQQFYNHLWRDKRPKIEALQLTQKAMQREPRFAHPRNWAAWVLAGEGW